MSMTLKGFISSSQGMPIVPSTAATGVVTPYPAVNVGQIVAGGYATRLDALVDLSLNGGFAKNGAFYLNLAASTPITVDATNTSGASTSWGGDTSFATLYTVEFTNLGPNDVIFGNAASNPALLGMTGTTPMQKIPANGGKLLIKCPAGFSTSGANNLKFDPGALPGQVGVTMGGA